MVTPRRRQRAAGRAACAPPLAAGAQVCTYTGRAQSHYIGRVRARGGVLLTTYGMAESNAEALGGVRSLLAPRAPAAVAAAAAAAGAAAGAAQGIEAVRPLERATSPAGWGSRLPPGSWDLVVLDEGHKVKVGLPRAVPARCPLRPHAHRRCFAAAAPAEPQDGRAPGRAVPAQPHAPRPLWDPHPEQ